MYVLFPPRDKPSRPISSLPIHPSIHFNHARKSTDSIYLLCLIAPPTSTNLSSDLKPAGPAAAKVKVRPYPNLPSITPQTPPTKSRHILTSTLLINSPWNPPNHPFADDLIKFRVKNSPAASAKTKKQHETNACYSATRLIHKRHARVRWRSTWDVRGDVNRSVKVRLPGRPT